ncbi:MAG: hypothetical protein ACOC2W_02865, partial [bacterium]
ENENKEFQKRQIAVKCNIFEIVSSKFVKQEGWQPNYIVSNGNKISRVNIICTITEKEETEQSLRFTVDDGSGNVDLVLFENVMGDNDIKVGDVINVIGKPREFNDNIYVMPEIIKKIDIDWVNVRKLEIELDSLKNKDGNVSEDEKNYNKDIQDVKEETITESVNEPKIEKKEENISQANDDKKVNSDDSESSEDDEEFETTPQEIVLEAIKSLDTDDDGVNHSELLSKVNFDNVDDILQQLLERGEIFEIMPGKYKVLE